MKKNRPRISWKILMVVIGFIMMIYASVVLPDSMSRTSAGYEPGPAFYPMLGVFVAGSVVFITGLTALIITFFKYLFFRKSMKDG